MTNWQFLIQKAEDQDWLPLESPSFEILEGRYQLVAMTHAPQQPVQVQIRYWDDQQDCPQAQLQQRLQYADAQGALNLLPSTYLGTGIWAIHCQLVGTPPDAASAPTHTLEMQVLPQDEIIEFADWEYLEAHRPIPHFSEQGHQMKATDRLPDTAPSLTSNLAQGDPSAHLILGVENLIRDRSLNESDHPISEEPPSPPMSLHDRPTLTDTPRPLEGDLPAPPKLTPELPSFSANIAPLPLRLSIGFRLPPDLGVSHTVLETLGSIPQLPELPKLNPDLITPMDPSVVAARNIALQISAQAHKTLNQAAINQAFQALPLKNRFWQTLNQLATSDASPDASTFQSNVTV
ncbi:hypothetical protein GS597_18270 [Synechococcales cyanobacterium C]|uniref:Uncharacterized protein n=1 Tax=Petrachloros mirabilis ULC683 TaxID=2781853 RepID=A0A8K2A0V6_9CYAN|nr:hypothetical protein [Petrachloros mirabilis]NCJ08418.1 hypothetical protein [Petrachloros mirabilis ULC683]